MPISSRRDHQTRTELVPLDLEAALDDLGVEVARGDDYEVWALCPNPKHDDHRPSNWSMNRRTGMHSCFSCGYSGSLLTLALALRFGTDTWAAATWVHRCGVDLTVHSSEPPAYLDGLEDIAPVLLPMTESRLAFYVPPPTDECWARGLSQDACAAYGVLWDARTGSWILPIRNPDTAKLQGWQRKTDKKVRNYPVGVEKSHTLFGYELLTEGQRVILVESPLDAVRFRTAGITGAVASYGAWVADIQMELILARTDELVVALDNAALDDAGRIGAGRLQIQWATRLHMSFFNYGDIDAKDPGDMSRAELQHGLATARVLADFGEVGVSSRSRAASTPTRRKRASSWSAAERRSWSSRKAPVRRAPR